MGEKNARVFSDLQTINTFDHVDYRFHFLADIFMSQPACLPPAFCISLAENAFQHPFGFFFKRFQFFFVQ